MSDAVLRALDHPTFGAIVSRLLVAAFPFLLLGAIWTMNRLELRDRARWRQRHLDAAGRFGRREWE